MPGIVLARMGPGARDSTLSLLADPPDSSYARQATDLAEGAYDTDLFNHCLRCWYFADLFGQLENQHYDSELLYIACLLHDLALTAAHRPTGKDAPCFAIHGGHLAAHTLHSWGVNDQAAATVDQAIAAHMDISVPTDQGLEARLLHSATHLDVAGAQAQKIPRSLIAQINQRLPRREFKTTFAAAMRREAADHPDSRTAVLCKLGLQLAIASNPLETIG
jgi:cyanamide hydratase family protein with HD domain